MKKETDTKYSKSLKSSINSLFNLKPLNVKKYRRKHLIFLIITIIFSHSIWIGLWIYYRLKDLWILNSEKLFFILSYNSIQIVQLLISILFGALMFCALFLGTYFINSIIFWKYKISKTELNITRITTFQFSFTPLFSIIMIIVSLLTQTYYYERGFIFYPFIMAIFYSFWMSYLNYKIYLSIEIDNLDNIMKKSSRAIFLIYSIGFFSLFLIVPFFFYGPYDLLFTIIW